MTLNRARETYRTLTDTSSSGCAVTKLPLLVSLSITWSALLAISCWLVLPSPTLVTFEGNSQYTSLPVASFRARSAFLDHAQGACPHDACVYVKKK